jgi:PPM family protein phosphatase
VIAGLATGIVAAYQWTQTRFYVGESDGTVAIYQGVQQGIGPISLSSVYQETGIDLDDLPEYTQTTVEQTISADDLQDARAIVERLEVASRE